MKIKYFLFFNVEKDRENPPEKQHSRGPKPVTESGVRNSSFFDEYEENGESESFFSSGTIQRNRQRVRQNTYTYPYLRELSSGSGN